MNHIVFLSRGHGYGHAAKDLQIIEAMQADRPDLKVTIASYDTGLAYYRARSVSCVDLGISDNNDQHIITSLQITHFLRQVDQPDLVVADEVFWSPSVCKMLGFKNLLLTHWFNSELELEGDDNYSIGADTLVMLDFAQAHCVPSDLKTPVHFTGALAREFSVNKQQARSILGLAPDASITVATVGAITPHKMTDIRTILSKLLHMWQTSASQADQLLILAKPDQVFEQPNMAHDERIDWVGISKTPELFFGAADLVLTNATFTTLSDLARNHIPTIAIIGPSNEVGRLHAQYYTSISLMKAVELTIDPDQLWALVQDVKQTVSSSPSMMSHLTWPDPTDVASFILSYLP